MDYDGNKIRWSEGYTNILMQNAGFDLTGGGIAFERRLPELVLSGYASSKHWGGAISTYNINHGILLNGIAGMQSAWNRAVFEASQPFRPVLYNGSAYMMSGDIMGISDLIGIGLSRVSEDHPYAAMALAIVSIVATKGRTADDVFEAEKGLLLQASQKKGIIKADYYLKI